MTGQTADISHHQMYLDIRQKDVGEYIGCQHMSNQLRCIKHLQFEKTIQVSNQEQVGNMILTIVTFVLVSLSPGVIG